MNNRREPNLVNLHGTMHQDKIIIISIKQISIINKKAVLLLAAFWNEESFSNSEGLMNRPLPEDSDPSVCLLLLLSEITSPDLSLIK